MNKSRSHCSEEEEEEAEERNATENDLVSMGENMRVEISEIDSSRIESENTSNE